MEGHPTGGSGGILAALASRLHRIPILAAAAVILVVNALHVREGLVRAAPQGPWEAGQVVEAWRSSRGLPVYEDARAGHATHMYGVLAPWTLGWIFRLTGPDNRAGRLLSLAAALGLTTLLAGLVARLLASDPGARPAAWPIAVAWALIVGVNHRCSDYFVENRPDMTALLLAGVGLFLLFAGQEGRRRGWFAVGIVCLAAGFLFKQTAAIFAVVPAIALWYDRRLSWRQWAPPALAPIAALAAIGVGLWVGCPTVYHYMIRVPRQYDVAPLSVLKMAKELLQGAPLFLVALGEWLLADDGPLREDRRVCWLVAALAVAVPASLAAAAKEGGADNSLLPALLPMMTFAAWRSARMLRRVEARAGAPLRRLALGALLAVLMGLSAFPRMTRSGGLWPRPSPWDGQYARVIRCVSRLPGRLICPEDPTIPLYAKGQAGRNIFLECDSHPAQGSWPAAAPAGVLEELAAADYVVDVHGWWQDPLEHQGLAALGFSPVAGTAIDPAAYTLWQRTRRPAVDLVLRMPRLSAPSR